MTNTECNYEDMFQSELNDDFKERKLYSRHLLKSYKRLGFENKYDKLKKCACHLDFNKLHNGAFKLKYADFCKDRLCPMCAWRRSKKIFSQVYSTVTFLENDYQFIFLTLTVPNCDACELGNKINTMNKAFLKMIKYKAVKAACFGYIRSLEVTYNRESDTFHPHFHVILAVSKDYFVSDSYIKREKWLEMWRKAMKDQTITMVDVRKIKVNELRTDTLNNTVATSAIASAVAEVAKYAVKSSDYIFTDSPVLTDKVTYVFSTVLDNRRLLSFGGCFAEARKSLGIIDDSVDGDLVHTSDNCAEDEVVAIYRYRWLHGKYQLYAIEYPEKLLLADAENDLLFDPETGEILEE